MTSSAQALHLSVVPERGPPLLRLVGALLEEQTRLTAVERFAQRHDRDELPDPRRYRDLLPASPPRPGEQYAFDVDLDLCSGCKACVAGCHTQNGLDETEIWRSVGLLHGGSSAAPVQVPVTTACHHCVEPACLEGCPVEAYEKDPLTGIVHHLDDQCIGCRYCTLTCPYEVPQYNSRLGIVRKCDLCADRLAEGEAPACVEACPNEAIAVRLVTEAEIIACAETDSFLAGAPSPKATLPSTRYETKRALPKNLLPVDYHSVRPAESHAPLVVMLVLTELSVGAFAAFAVTGRGPALPPVAATVALATGLLALASSLSHLGRPHLAFRAVLGLRRSWLSREIVAFGLFATAATLHAVLAWTTAGGASWHVETLARWTVPIVIATGALGIACSVMVYHATRRRVWAGPSTAVRFFGTAAVLGLSACLVAAAAAGDVRALPRLAIWLAFTSAIELVFELSIFVHLRDRRQTELKRSAQLLLRELSGLTFYRFWCGGAGGLLLPAVLAAALVEAPALGLVRALAGAIFVLVLAGHLLERSLFFRAAIAPRMPGSLA